MKEFKERVAVITGAASGIGRSLAQRCAQEGMKVVLADVNPVDLASTEAELRAAGGTVLAVPTDVARRPEVEALAHRALEAFGGVHLLFNNAGVSAGTTVWESSWNDWEWVLGVNLWGVIHGVKVFTPIMLDQKADAHIVNTASAAGLLTYHPTATYHVSKSAIVTLSENLCLSLAQRKARVKVSVVCPGNVRTQILDADRNRPPELRDETPAVGRSNVKRVMRSIIERGMPPDKVAEQIFVGIREERFYILTHPEVAPLLGDRLHGVLEGRDPRRP